jgi:hypothetical protein
MSHKFLRAPSTRELLAIGCTMGQEVLFQVHEITTGRVRKKTNIEIRVYDKKTKKLIGVIER